MFNSFRIAFLRATLFGLITDDVMGGMSQSFRGANMQNLMVHRLGEELSEADMPNMHETVENALAFDWLGGIGKHQAGEHDAAEKKDSDDTESYKKSDEVDIESGEFEGMNDLADTIEHLTRVSRIADTNGDGILSSQELVEFADKLRSKTKWEHSRSALGALDTNGDGQLAHAELETRVLTPAKSDGKKRFAAADLNDDGLLNETEFHGFAYPATDHRVLKIETMHHFEIFDKDQDDRISLEEFIQDSKELEDFSYEAAHEDFHLHDVDGSGDLDVDEFERFLAGHDLLLDSVHKAISAADSDGDGHISISEEVPNAIQGLLDSEYIEDFFYHEHASGHQEL